MSEPAAPLQKPLVTGNFMCLGFALAHGLIGVLPEKIVVTSQASAVLQLLMLAAAAWAGAAFWRRMVVLEPSRRDAVFASTFILTAGALNVVFSPESPPSVFTLAPFLLLGAWMRPPHPLDWEGLTASACQILALSLLLPVFSHYSLNLAAAVGIRAGLQHLFFQNDPQLSRAALSPIMALWFFVNLSNQLALAYPGWPRTLAGAGVAAYAAFVGAGLVLRRCGGAGVQTLNRTCLILFAASLFSDVNLEAGMSVPLHHLDFHWWIHVAPGLDALYRDFKPFVDYIPFEGFIFETMLPRLWFEGLNQSNGGFMLLMALLYFLSQLLFVWMLAWLFRALFGMPRFFSALAAFAPAIVNLPLLQIGYPFPGAWTIAERSLAGFACALLTAAFLLRSRAGTQAPSRFKEEALPWTIGVLHFVSFLYEPLFGLAGLAGLCAALLLDQRRSGGRLKIILGGAAALLVFLILFHIPWRVFFLHQPLAMIQSGGNLVDVGKGLHIFQVFIRGRILSTLHYSMSLAAMIGFLALAPTRARKHEGFPMAGYFFAATAFMVISGGQRFFGQPMNTFGAVHFIAMASVFTLPLILCVCAMAWDLWGKGVLPARKAALALAALVILIAFTDGLQHGMTPGPLKAGLNGQTFEAISWKDQKHAAGHHSFSVPSILAHYYTQRSRAQVLRGRPPLEVHRQPYSAWKDRVEAMPAVQDIRAFISMSRPGF